MQIAVFVIISTIILVVIFFIKKGRNNSTTNDDATDIDKTVCDEVAVYINQTSKQQDKKKNQTESNEDPCANSIEMQNLSPLF